MTTAKRCNDIVLKQWYEKLFENYGNKYDSEPFTHGTAGEGDEA